MTPRRRWLVPEVIQASRMDCGPAAIQSMLSGFGINVAFERLREACRTTVDGTSIDDIEVIANSLGLDAEQILVPIDHVLLKPAECLPCVAVTRLPSGVAHFIVLWRVLGNRVQIMDPARGRHWVHRRWLQHNLLFHPVEVPRDTWTQVIRAPAFKGCVQQRLQQLGVGRIEAKRIVGQCAKPTHWRPMSALDALVRFTGVLVRRGAIARGRAAARFIRSVHPRVAGGRTAVVPHPHWSIELAAKLPSEQLLAGGTVLVRARRRSEHSEPAASLPDDVARALVSSDEGKARPLRRLWGLLRQDGLLGPGVLLLSLLVASVGLTVQALLLRSLLDLGSTLDAAGNAIVVGGFLALLALLGLVELPQWSMVAQAGRRLETRVRLALLRKIPRLAGVYFESRLKSDTAERAHLVHRLRDVPLLALSGFESLMGLALTVGGIAWLAPTMAPWAVAAAMVALAAPLCTHPVLAERDLRLRAHAGALSTFYLDALLGLTAIRTHRAERSVAREHEGRLVDWANAGLQHHRVAVVVDAIQGAVGLSLAGLLLWRFMVSHSAPGGALLVLYWSLQIPALGRRFAAVMRSYPVARSIAMRLFEPLDATECEVGDGDTAVGGPEPLQIRFERVSLEAAGQVILRDINWNVPAGQHVAVVGSSGAGKSSLMRLLLGWQSPSRGQILVDGVPLPSTDLSAYRRRVAWIDPTVTLWNTTLASNLSFGNEDTRVDIARAIEQVELRATMSALDDGLQTQLGEEGRRLSGGEGQRVRLARSIAREEVGLLAMDEPFRGLDRCARRRILRRIREQYAGQTIVFITHDIELAAELDRVAVVQDGRIVQDGAPAELLARPGALRKMLDEDDVAASRWADPAWRRLTVEGGQVR